MLEVETFKYRDAKAGNYKPTLYGKIRELISPYEKVPFYRGLLGPQITLLDISFYQMYAEFDKMKANGVSGVIIRAGQNTWADNKANIFMSGAEAEGIPVGSYWFYDSRVDFKLQAKKWKEVLGNHKTPLLCWADYEENYGGSYGGWKNFYNFLEACKREMPDRKFGIYTGYYYWLEHSPITSAELNYFAEYPLWLAWYANDISYVKIPRPWKEMVMWQRTASGDGVKYGVGSKEVDMNSFIGTQQQFTQFFGLEPTIPTDTGETMQVIKGKTTNQNVLLRQGPSTGYPTIAVNGRDYIPANTEIEASFPNETKWLNITKIGGIEVTVEAWASAGSDQQYIKWGVQEVPTEPIPTVKVPFTLQVTGYKPFSGELEKE